MQRLLAVMVQALDFLFKLVDGPQQDAAAVQAKIVRKKERERANANEQQPRGVRQCRALQPGQTAGDHACDKQTRASQRHHEKEVDMERSGKTFQGLPGNRSINGGGVHK